MNINYRIDKKELVNSFKDYIASTIDRNDLYSSNGKQVQYRNDYITLEKIKSIYNYIIKYIKLGIRKELIHDDDAYIFIINKLNDRMNNKIRSTSNGKFYMSVGLKDPINFDGNKDQYESYIYNKANLARLVKKIVEELNAVLENNITQEKDKTVINNNIKEHITPVHIINKLLENINKKIILEIFEGNFSNFDKYYFEFMKENNIDLDLAKKMIENIHSSFIDSDVPVNMLNKKIQEVDPPKQIYKRFDDPGIENRREKSMDQLRGRGLTPKGGGWHNKRDELVATIGDRGEIIWKSETSSKQSATPYNQTKSYAAAQSADIEDNQQPQEKAIETGLSDKELEYIRKTFRHSEVENV